MKKPFSLILILVLFGLNPIAKAGPFGIMGEDSQAEEEIDPEYYCVSDEEAFGNAGYCIDEETYWYYYDYYMPVLSGQAIEQSVIEKIPGYYYFNTPYDDGYSPVMDVESLLYIPAGLDLNIPSSLVVFYHGMTDDKNYYKNISSLKSWADTYGFMVLSIQNYWVLNYYTYDTEDYISQITGSQASINAAMNIAESMERYGVLDRDLVFVTGFSAGGIPAQSAMAGFPYFFHGLGDFSGNFYGTDVGYFYEDYISKAEIIPKLQTDNYRQYDDVLILSSYGGVNEPERIQSQMPESIDFWQDHGAYVNYYEHSSGHAMTQSAFVKFIEKVFWPAHEINKTRDKDLFFERDIDFSPYKEAILNLKNQGIIDGYEDGSFRQWKKINRAEFTKLTMEAKGFVSGPRNCFDDVSNQWFANYVCQAQLEGIIDGYDDELFHPERFINVVEALKIVLEAFEAPVEDLKKGEDWYEPYLDYAQSHGLYLETFDSLDEQISREDMAELLYRIMN